MVNIRKAAPKYLLNISNYFLYFPLPVCNPRTTNLKFTPHAKVSEEFKQSPLKQLKTVCLINCKNFVTFSKLQRWYGCRLRRSTKSPLFFRQDKGCLLTSTSDGCKESEEKAGWRWKNVNKPAKWKQIENVGKFKQRAQTHHTQRRCQRERERERVWERQRELSLCIIALWWKKRHGISLRNREKPFSNCHVVQRGCEAEPVDGEPCKQTVVFVEAAYNVGNLWQLWQLVTTDNVQRVECKRVLQHYQLQQHNRSESVWHLTRWLGAWGRAISQDMRHYPARTET